MAAITPTLRYSIEIESPQTHYALVNIQIENNTSDVLHFQMPVWTPGSYLIREFSRNVESVTALSNGAEVAVAHLNKNTWILKNTKNKTIEFKYKLYAFEYSVRTSYIDFDEAFLHNTSVFMMVKEYQHLPGKIKLHYPERWKNIATTLNRENVDLYSFENYDDLADSPIEIGNFTRLEFQVMGVPHSVALIGENNCDTAKFTADLKMMCEVMAQIVGQHPCKSYLFIVKNVESGGGGLEHSNSCTVMMNRWNWVDETKYRNFLGLCAHEYFHLWNVKRIRPAELGPFDYSTENYTDLLWVAEGITSYYDELAILRAGLISQKEFLSVFEDAVNKLENRPGSKVQSLAESSRDAWIKEYRPNENSTNTTISYYSKGLVVAGLLDITICKNTKGKRNLDDLMRLLYQRYYIDKNRGFTPEEFEKAASEIAGISLKDFLNNLVYTVNKPEYGIVFAGSGIGVDAEEHDEYKLGIICTSETGKTLVKEILKGSSAMNADIQPGDELISINDIRVNNDEEKILKNIGFPEELNLLISRRGVTRTVQIHFHPAKRIQYFFTLPEGSAAQNDIINKWLGS